MLSSATHLAGSFTLPRSALYRTPARAQTFPEMVHLTFEYTSNFYNMQRQYLRKAQRIAMEADAGLPRHGGRVGVALHQPPHGHRQQTLRRQQLRRLCWVANRLATAKDQRASARCTASVTQVVADLGSSRSMLHAAEMCALHRHYTLCTSPDCRPSEAHYVRPRLAA